MKSCILAHACLCRYALLPTSCHCTVGRIVPSRNVNTLVIFYDKSIDTWISFWITTWFTFQSGLPLYLIWQKHEGRSGLAQRRTLKVNLPLKSCLWNRRRLITSLDTLFSYNSLTAFLVDRKDLTNWKVKLTRSHLGSTFNFGHLSNLFNAWAGSRTRLRPSEQESVII